jgi:hypothetical protein
MTAQRSQPRLLTEAACGGLRSAPDLPNSKGPPSSLVQSAANMAKEDAKPSAGSPLASGDLINGCYRLLLHNQDRLFLVRPFKGITAAKSASADHTLGSGRADPGARRIHELRIVIFFGQIVACLLLSDRTANLSAG